jgi:hypothetical protein
MSNGPVHSKQIDELLAFPVLIQESGTAGATRHGTSSAGPGNAPLGQIVENTLRNVLGWRPREGDPKGFLAALHQSFTSRDVEGRQELRWSPRGAAVGIQADLGAITGAQASLYTRARNTLEQVLPLLDSLRPLRSEPDLEDTQGMRAIIRTELIELVNELGIVGGPRIARVDQIFELLLGTTVFSDAPGSVAGQLALLQERFGLLRAQAKRVEEEKVYSDFLTLVDYIRSLAMSWEARRDSFRRGGRGEAFLGTRLVLLSRELAVTSESVEEVQFALDSVFLGPAERATFLLSFDGSEAPITLAELLDWIHVFVAREAPALLGETGKDGLLAFRSTLGRLEELVELLLDEKTRPSRLNVPRVVRALEELRDHLHEALVLAEDIDGDEPPPADSDEIDEPAFEKPPRPASRRRRPRKP